MVTAIPRWYIDSKISMFHYSIVNPNDSYNKQLIPVKFGEVIKETKKAILVELYIKKDTVINATTDIEKEYVKNHSELIWEFIGELWLPKSLIRKI